MNSRRVATKQILAKLSFSNLINLISSSKVIFTWFPFVFVLSVCLLGWVSLDSSWNLSLNERRTRNQINKLDWRTQIGFVWWRGWGFIYWDTIIIQVEIVWYHSWNCQRWVGPYEPLLIGSSQKKVLKLSTLTKIKSLQSQNRLKRSSAPVWATYMLWDKVRAIENILKEHIGNLTRPFLLLCLSSLSQFLGIYTCWNKIKKSLKPFCITQVRILWHPNQISFWIPNSWLIFNLFLGGNKQHWNSKADTYVTHHTQ